VRRIKHSVRVVNEREPASIIGYLHSTSFASARLFNTRLEEFDVAALELLDNYTVDGIVSDQNDFGILIARRE
jgi:hypothetical protein